MNHPNTSNPQSFWSSMAVVDSFSVNPGKNPLLPQLGKRRTNSTPEIFSSPYFVITSRGRSHV